AIKDVGGIIINHIIAKDVKSAAQSADEPLQTIAAALRAINDHWARQAIQDSREICDLAWHHANRNRDFASRSQLLAIWQAEIDAPVSASQADNALDALVAANSKIATAGPTASIAEIQQALKTASDAYAAYKAIVGK